MTSDAPGIAAPPPQEAASWGPDFGKVVALLAGMTLARCVAAVAAPLLASEAYYWLWGQRPALGYVDHPPMVGWMSAIFFGWVRQSQLAARSGPIILGALTTLTLYRLARDLFPATRAAWTAALVFSLAPILNAFSVAIQPDNSLNLFCALTWLCFWRAANAEKPGAELRWWIATGVFTGLALLSKFHAWALLPPLYGFLLFSSERRRRLARLGPWLAIVIALVVLSPNLIWNARHDWLTYGFQAHRSGLHRPGFHPVFFLVYAFGPAGTLSPLVYAALAVGAWRALAGLRRKREAPLEFLLWAGLPLPLVLGVLSTRVSISLHWPMAAYLPLLVLAAGLIERGDLFGPRFRKAMILSAASITAVLHVAPLAARVIPAGLVSPYRPKEINSTRLKRELIDWRAVGDAVRRVKERQPGSARVVVMTWDSHMAALLAFHAALPQDCYTLSTRGGHNFELWRKEAGGLAGCDALVVESEHGEDLAKGAEDGGDETKMAEELDGLFDKVEPLAEVLCFPDGHVEEAAPNPPPGAAIRAFLVYHCSGFKGRVLDKSPM